MPSGYLTTLPTNVVLDEGVVYVNSTTAFGATDGPVNYDEGAGWQNIDFAGKRSDISGLDRVIMRMPKMEFDMIAINSTTSATLITGSSQTGTPLVVTPVAASGLVAANGTNVKVYFKQGGGTYFGVVFAKALIKMTSVTGRDKNSALLHVVIEGRLDLSASTDTDVSPVKYEIAAASIT